MMQQNSHQAANTPTNRSNFPEDFYHDPTGVDRYVVQERELVSWKAPSKLERERNLREFIQVLLLTIMIGLILLLIGEFLLTIVLGAMGILYVVMITAKPTFLNIHVTTIGIKVEEKYYFWPMMTQFWFEDRLDEKVLSFRYFENGFHVGRFLVPPSEVDHIQQEMGKFLLCKKPSLSRFEAWLDTLSTQVRSFFDLV
jgi:hypothetical protein